MDFGLNLNTVVSAASLMFGGPTGALAAQMFSQVAGKAIEQGIQQSGEQMGLPQSQIDSALASFSLHAGTGDLSHGVSELLQDFRNSSPADSGDLDRQTQKLMEQVRDYVNDALQEMADGGSGQKASKSRGGKGDFFTALAEGLGKALQKQADIVQKKANDLSAAVDDAKGTSENERSDAQNKIMELQTELSAESMRLNYMATGIQTSLSKIGEALSTVGRAQ